MKKPRLTLLKRIRMSAGPFTTTIERGMLVERSKATSTDWSVTLAGELPLAFAASRRVLFEAGKYRGNCELLNLRTLKGADALVRLF